MNQIKITPDGLINLTDKCVKYMNAFCAANYAFKRDVWSWSSFKYVELIEYKNLPEWYHYKTFLIRYMHKLHDIADNAKLDGSEIFLTELKYYQLILLARGDRKVNPCFILGLIGDNQ